MSQALPLAVLAGCFAFFAAWEAGDPLAPFANPAARRRHIARNLALFAILFALANGLSLVADRFAPLPYDGAADGIAARLSGSLAVQCVLGLVLLDLWDYAFHRLCHRVPILWRLHRVHHAEAQLDVSTAMRFHPLETLLGISVRIGLLAGLGLPLWIEGVRAVVVNPLALAQHANVRLPSWYERLHVALVTPGLHRLHHSIDPRDHDRNFGQLFSWWDRVFGTYTQPAIGDLRFGLAGFEDARWQTVRGMLLTPLRGGGDRPLLGSGTG